MDRINDICSLLHRACLPLNAEKAAQAALEDLLKLNGVEFEREVALSPADIVDFMIGDIAVEMKLKGSVMDIYRQLCRYAAHDRVKGLVLLTSKAMSLPELINDKPARVVSMSRAWL